MHAEHRAFPSQDWDCPLAGDVMAVRLPAGYATIRSGIEFAAALLLLALTWPIILLLMALIRATSPGPALYKQTRVGLHGRLYTIYKLRTMAHECEKATGPLWSPPRDSRATRPGPFLRHYHLDELPQLWNVLRGEMSLIGPRPERPEFVVRLECEIADYRQRLKIRPGITGLAQIQLPPDQEVGSVWRKVAYDIHYVNNIGPSLDARILLGTALKLLGVPYHAIGRVLRLPVPRLLTIDRQETLASSPEESARAATTTPDRQTLAFSPGA